MTAKESSTLAEIDAILLRIEANLAEIKRLREASERDPASVEYIPPTAGYPQNLEG